MWLTLRSFTEGECWSLLGENLVSDSCAITTKPVDEDFWNNWTSPWYHCLFVLSTSNGLKQPNHALNSSRD